MDYLEWLPLAGGFGCADCSHAGGWAMADGRFRCEECGGRTATRAGTIFDRTRTPFTVWVSACWMFATQKNGVPVSGPRYVSQAQ